MTLKQHAGFLLLAMGAAAPGRAAETSLSDLLRNTIAAAERQYDRLLERLPADGRLPRSFHHEKLVTVTPADWTSGFFPGSLWYLYEATGNTKWRDVAAHQTALLESQQFNRSIHDVGFMLYCSYGNGLRLTGETNYRTVLLNGAASLSTRFNSAVGCIRSWDFKPWTYPVIIDNMMNLELLLWAAGEGQIPRYREFAVSHADRTLANHFRENNSSFHVVDYDPATGAVRAKQTHQGAADSSAWARGQAWGLYGYTMMYRETRNERYLLQARNIARFIMGHPRLPADRIPYWDFDTPGIPDAPRDVAAAAIVCSALFELSTFVNAVDADFYTRFAEDQLRTMTGPSYFAAPGGNGGFLLLHATGNHPAGGEIDAPLNYADYYFLEAIVRALKRQPDPANLH